MKKLYLELSSLEHMGTTIWFEGVPSNSKEVTEELSVTEENSYMRDYIFNEGVLTELRSKKRTFDNGLYILQTDPVS